MRTALHYLGHVLALAVALWIILSPVTGPATQFDMRTSHE
jgi:hypothetical protein